MISSVSAEQSKSHVYIPPDVNVRHSQIVTFLLIALALGPALAVDIPAMLDYPNHLAIMSVLSRSGTAAANPFYQVHWNFNTNLAMELIVPPLARLVGLVAAGKTFLLLSQLLVVGGAMALERVVRGTLKFSPFAAVTFLYSLPFAWGFTNFEFGLGVALCAIATWLSLETRPLFARAIVHSVFVVILFVAHLFALGVYGATLGLHELWRLRSGRASVRQALLTMVVLATPAVVVLGLMPILGHSVAGAASETEWRFDLKALWIFEAMNGYSIILSYAGMGLILVACFILCLRGYLTLVGSGAWIAIGFAILYVAVPYRLMGTAVNDVRIVIAAALILPSFVQLSLPNSVWRRTAFWTAVGCAVANVTLVWWVWLSYRSEYSALISSFGRMAKDSTVLVAVSYPRSKPGGDPTDYPSYHGPTLAVAYANALVPSLFAYPGDRPVTLRSAYQQYAEPDPGLLAPTLPDLANVAFGAHENLPSYLQSWPSKYDYLYVVGPYAPNPIPLVLHELDRGRGFALYQIDRPAKANR
jgi:hypothetical protein